MFPVATLSKGQNRLIGYSGYANWSLLWGVRKSGYQDLGGIWMIGRKKKYIVLFSKALKIFGIERALNKLMH